MLTFEVVCETEYEDFKKLLELSGRSVDDFELSEIEDPMVGVGVQPITGRVTVTHKPTGKSKTYECGNATAWVAQFRNDLIAGAYS